MYNGMYSALEVMADRAWAEAKRTGNTAVAKWYEAVFQAEADRCEAVNVARESGEGLEDPHDFAAHGDEEAFLHARLEAAIFDTARECRKINYLDGIRKNGGILSESDATRLKIAQWNLADRLNEYSQIMNYFMVMYRSRVNEREFLGRRHYVVVCRLGRLEAELEELEVMVSPDSEIAAKRRELLEAHRELDMIEAYNAQYAAWDY